MIFHNDVNSQQSTINRYALTDKEIATRTVMAMAVASARYESEDVYRIDYRDFIRGPLLSSPSLPPFLSIPLSISNLQIKIDFSNPFSFFQYTSSSNQKKNQENNLMEAPGRSILNHSFRIYVDKNTMRSNTV